MQGGLVMESFIKVFVLIYLAYQTYKDIREKQVSLRSIIMFSLVGVVINISITNISLFDMILGSAVGFGVILIGKLMKDGIGTGDGAVLSSIGILMGGKICLLIFLIAITISAVIVIFLLVFKKVKMKQELPFIPYILFAYMLILM